MDIGRKLKILCTFNLRPVYPGEAIFYREKISYTPPFNTVPNSNSADDKSLLFIINLTKVRKLKSC